MNITTTDNKILGTNVSSPIRPYTTDDTYPTAIDNEIQGGCHTCKTLEDMRSIPKDRRSLYMLVSVGGTALYTLKNNPTTESTAEADWVLIAGKAPTTTPNILNTFLTSSEDTKNAEEKVVVPEYHYLLLTNMISSSGVSDQEILCPFDAKLEKVKASIPMSFKSNSDLDLQLKFFNKTLWTTIAVFSVGKDTYEGTFTPTTETVIPEGSRITLSVSGNIKSENMVFLSTLVTISKNK